VSVPVSMCLSVTVFDCGYVSVSVMVCLCSVCLCVRHVFEGLCVRVHEKMAHGVFVYGVFLSFFPCGRKSDLVA